MVVRDAQGVETRCGGGGMYDDGPPDNLAAYARYVKQVCRTAQDLLSRLIDAATSLDRNLGPRELQAIIDASDDIQDLGIKCDDASAAIGELTSDGSGDDIGAGDAADPGDDLDRDNNPAATQKRDKKAATEAAANLRTACRSAVASCRTAHDRMNAAMDTMNERGAKMNANEHRCVRDAVTHAQHVGRKAGEMRAAAADFDVDLNGIADDLAAPPGESAASKDGRSRKPDPKPQPLPEPMAIPRSSRQDFLMELATEANLPPEAVRTLMTDEQASD
jgi:hypothetical protein